MIWSIFLFYPFLAEASSDDGVPWLVILFQFINFSLFVSLLAYLIKKYVPEFLNQKRSDFLEYRKRAFDLEQQYEKSCLKLEKEIAKLDERQKNLKANVKKTIEQLKQELVKKEESDLENLRRRNKEELQRQRLKNLNQLKEKILKKVLSLTASELQQALDAQRQNVLNWSFVKELEKIK